MASKHKGWYALWCLVCLPVILIAGTAALTERWAGRLAGFMMDVWEFLIRKVWRDDDV